MPRKKKLCDACGKLPSTTIATVIVGSGKSKKRHRAELCDPCLSEDMKGFVGWLKRQAQ